MRVNLLRFLFLCLVTLPFSPKFEIFGSVKFFLQDILLFVGSLGLLTRTFLLQIPKIARGYLYLFAALLVMLLATLLSFYNQIDMVSLVKVFKYLFYTIALILVARYGFQDFLAIFNRIALITISVSLLLFVIDLISFIGSVGEFLQASVWKNELIPTGLYNYVINIADGRIYETGGTHGVYGAYLVLVLLINYSLLGDERRKKGALILVLLSLVNILVLTSRETLLLLLVLLCAVLLRDLYKARLNRRMIVFVFLAVFAVVLLVVFGVKVGVVEKVAHTIRSLGEEGTEGNIQIRFNIWKCIFLSYFNEPINIITGIGYNLHELKRIITDSAIQYNIAFDPKYGTTTESFFMMFLVYGGIISFFFAVAFWMELLIRLFGMRKHNNLCFLFLVFTCGLFINNNTGGSMLSDMFMIQYGLSYFWLSKIQK